MRPHQRRTEPTRLLRRYSTAEAVHRYLGRHQTGRSISNFTADAVEPQKQSCCRHPAVLAKLWLARHVSVPAGACCLGAPAKLQAVTWLPELATVLFAALAHRGCPHAPAYCDGVG